MIYGQLTGRCANGSQLDAGTRVHAIDAEPGHFYFATALCGAKPGRRSNGWSDYTYDAATCPRCLKKLERSEWQTAVANWHAARDAWDKDTDEEAEARTDYADPLN